MSAYRLIRSSGKTLLALFASLLVWSASMQNPAHAQSLLETDTRVTTGVPAGFESKFADVNGVRIHYVIGGRGPALVLLHGWPETWYEWRPMLPLLAKDFTVIAPDLRGMGDSSLEPSGYDKKTL